MLTMNWRSRTPILDFGAGIIVLNGDEQVHKDLVAMRGDGAPVVAQGFYSKKEETEFIVRVVKLHRAGGMKPSDELYVTGQFGTGPEARRVMNGFLREAYGVLGMDWSSVWPVKKRARK